MNQHIQVSEKLYVNKNFKLFLKQAKGVKDIKFLKFLALIKYIKLVDVKYFEGWFTVKLIRNAGLNIKKGKETI